MTAEQAPPAGRALVLGGGGLSGIAWETGILAGLSASGADVTTADYVLGTSAGATVTAQLGSELSLSDLLARRTVPELQSAELTPDPAAKPRHGPGGGRPEVAVHIALDGRCDRGDGSFSVMVATGSIFQT